MMKSGFTTLPKILLLCCVLALLSGYAWWRHDQAKQAEARQLEEIKKAEAADRAKRELQSMFKSIAAP